MAIVLFALAGFLAGGAYTLFRNGSSKVAAGVVGTLAVLAAAAGVLWTVCSVGKDHLCRKGSS
jgi:hypothetical protein